MNYLKSRLPFTRRLPEPLPLPQRIRILQYEMRMQLGNALVLIDKTDTKSKSELTSLLSEILKSNAQQNNLLGLMREKSPVEDIPTKVTIPNKLKPLLLEIKPTYENDLGSDEEFELVEKYADDNPFAELEAARAAKDKAAKAAYDPTTDSSSAAVGGKQYKKKRTRKLKKRNTKKIRKHNN